MKTHEPRNGNGLWAQRRMLILRTLDEFNGTADRDTIFKAVSNIREFTTQGPQELDQRAPKYYFEQALRKLMDWNLVEHSDGHLALTEDGREEMAAAQ